MDELRQWWQNTPSHKPGTLEDIFKEGLAEIPDCFDRSGDYTKNIMIAADLVKYTVSP